MNNHSIEEIAGRLEAYFRDRDDVLVAFIFGSSVTGRLTDQSDVDIALLFSGPPGSPDILKLKHAVEAEMGRDVDVVVLNGSSPIIGMQVLKNGRVIKGRASAAYSGFVVRTVKEYDDLKRIRREAEENILKGRIYA